MATKPNTKVVTALTARTQFGQIVRGAAAKGERFVVEPRGDPRVVIMGVGDFVKTIGAWAPPPVRTPPDGPAIPAPAACFRLFKGNKVRTSLYGTRPSLSAGR